MLKFLLLILLIAAVWYGWRYINRKPPAKPPAAAEPKAPQEQSRARKTIAEDLKPCPVCGTYMVVDPNLPPAQAAAKTCGRPDCRPA
jgi:hypothetical protein